MQVFPDIVAKRRDRSIAILLGFKERECDPFLSAEVSGRLRKAILDQINDLCDFFLDIMKSYSDNDLIELNEIYLQKLSEIHEAVVGDNGE